jgi:hypothetical protein
LASPYCFDVELAHAIKRHDRGDARVIPVILRACDWQNAPFAKLQVLPKDGRAVASWKDRDEACTDIARGIRSAVTKLRGPRDSSEADASEPEREPAGNFAATLGATGIARVGWRDVVPFAALSLAGFLCVAGLLTLMTWKPEWLPAVHLTSSFYYIVLLTLGLAAATFLFRVFRCYARYTGKVLRTHLKPVWLIVAGAILVAARVFLPRTESLVGHVQDTAGHPVCSAVVGVEESHANVDADGHFSLEVRRGSPPDGVAGEISAPGFETWRGKLIPKGAEAAVILKRIP